MSHTIEQKPKMLARVRRINALGGARGLGDVPLALVDVGDDRRWKVQRLCQTDAGQADTTGADDQEFAAGRKGHEFFERAVELDPRNGEAFNDLFDYYLQAPGILGGGYDKAAEVAKRIGQLNPAEGHFAQAQLAEKRWV